MEPCARQDQAMGAAERQEPDCIVVCGSVSEWADHILKARSARTGGCIKITQQQQLIVTRHIRDGRRQVAVEGVLVLVQCLFCWRVGDHDCEMTMTVTTSGREDSRRDRLSGYESFVEWGPDDESDSLVMLQVTGV